MSDADRGHGVAFARAALAGNPSDGYGGAVLAFTFGERRAEATATTAARAMAPVGAIEPAAEIVKATVRRFAREHEARALHSTIAWKTDIPRGVGLGGSSAIVIATARALCDLHRVGLDRTELAGFALAVETEELGIAAGLQDRVAQSHGGLTFMDFGAGGPRPDGHGRYEQLEADALPPLLIAWCTDAVKESSAVHAPLRERFDRGEPVVVDGMAELGELARAARAAVIAGDRPGLARCVERNFEVRRRMLALHPRHVELVECARANGASANYTGSGGAIVAVCANRLGRERTRAALERIGASTLAPTVCI